MPATRNKIRRTECKTITVNCHYKKYIQNIKYDKAIKVLKSVVYKSRYIIKLFFFTCKLNDCPFYYFE